MSHNVECPDCVYLAPCAKHRAPPPPPRWFREQRPGERPTHKFWPESAKSSSDTPVFVVQVAEPSVALVDEVVRDLRYVEDDKWEGHASPKLCGKAADLIEAYRTEAATLRAEREELQFAWDHLLADLNGGWGIVNSLDRHAKRMKDRV